MRLCKSALLCDLLNAPTALAACCGFDLCYKYIWYLVFARARNANDRQRSDRLSFCVKDTDQVSRHTRQETLLGGSATQASGGSAIPGPRPFFS